MARSRKRASSLRTYVALLRGINLGARNKVSMAYLRTLFLTLGGEDVATYVQSGNVVFRSQADSPADLIGKVERRISRDLGLRITVLLRTKAELARIAARNPFAESESEPTKLLVTFLAEAPGRARVRGLDPARFAPDEFHLAGKDVYLHCPNGYGKTKLSNAYFENQLGVSATTRNWKTVTKLTELTRSR